MVVEKNFRHSKTRTAKYLIITPASYETLYTPSNLRVSESHFRHSLFEYRVFRWLTEKGYKPVKECQIKGGKIDVFCEVLVKDLKPETPNPCLTKFQLFPFNLRTSAFTSRKAKQAVYIERGRIKEENWNLRS